MTVAHTQRTNFDQQDLTKHAAPLVRSCLRQTKSFSVESSLRVLLDRSRQEIQMWEEICHKHVYHISTQRIAGERLVSMDDAKMAARIAQAVQELQEEVVQGWRLLEQFNRNCILLDFKFKDCRLVGVTWEMNRKVTQ